MLLKCECTNTTADATCGNGWRDHTRLNPRKGTQNDPVVWMCVCCGWVRSKNQGLKTGEKK